MTYTTDGKHTENRWQEQFMIGGKIHGLLRTHTAVSRNVFRPIKCLKHFFSSSCQHFPNAVWNHFQISSAKTQFAKIGGYQSRLSEIYSSTRLYFLFLNTEILPQTGRTRSIVIIIPGSNSLNLESFKN